MLQDLVWALFLEFTILSLDEPASVVVLPSSIDKLNKTLLFGLHFETDPRSRVSVCWGCLGTYLLKTEGPMSLLVYPQATKGIAS